MASPTQIPIIDSHVHLWPASEQDTLAWLTPDFPLYGQHSLDDYLLATSSPSSTTTASSKPQPHPALEGFIYLEVDRRTDHDNLSSPSSWAHPLSEIAYCHRVASGTPHPSGTEGHSASQAKLMLGIVPWAPVPAGPEVLEAYFKEVEKVAGSSFPKIRGVRYLVQDKPAGTMGTPEMIEGLKWLGRKGLVFDVGIDIHRRGEGHVEECLDMMRRAHEGVTATKEKVVFVLNHLIKPDLSIAHRVLDASEDDASKTEREKLFNTWRSNIYELSRVEKTYMKLSGLFTELDKEFVGRESVEGIFEVVQPWLAVVLGTFGPRRLMWGSDWPVCELGPGKGAWGKWRAVVERMCELAGLGVEDRVMLWSGTAAVAYGLDV